MNRKKVKRAIRLIEESRESHVWALMNPGDEELGTPKFHKRCVREYDYVLSVLREVKELLV